MTREAQIMPVTKKKARQKNCSVIYLPVDEIIPNPSQPRRTFRDEPLKELAASVAQLGVLNPLSVRMRAGKFELVAGERRLRASKMAGLSEVPCILLDINMEESSLLALVENLQRQDLNFLEEAEGIARLIRTYSLSQEEAARRLGKSQSAVANKLRLLKLPSDVLEGLLEAELSERHGRALLRLPTAEAQRAALNFIIENAMTVAVTDIYIDSLLTGTATLAEIPQYAEKVRGKTLFVLKDVRIFLNTLSRSMEVMKQGGIAADMRRQETDNELILTINIPKKK
jgi:ParB family chromosome partitioning protein